MDGPEPRDASERLRAADPAPVVNGTWAESPARAIAHQRLADEGADVINIGRSDVPRRRQTLWPSVAAAAVLAVALGVAALEWHGTDRAPTASGSTSTDPTTSSEQKRKTEALLDSLLAEVPEVPGARTADTSPSHLLDGAQSWTGSPNTVDRHRWWTAPGTVDDVCQYLHDHRPTGLLATGTTSSNDPKSGEYVEMLAWEGYGTDYATYVEVQVAVTEVDGGVGIRADAQAIWLPVRDPADVLGEVTSVDVTITRTIYGGGVVPGGPTVRRTLTGADAQTLATLVDGLTEDMVPARGCVNQLGHFVDAFTFRTVSGRTLEVTAAVSGCPQVTVSVPGRPDLLLVAGTLDTEALHLLGLPADYGYR